MHTYQKTNKEKEKLKKAKYMIVNVWRSTDKLPVQCNPLALCDSQSVDHARKQSFVMKEIGTETRTNLLFLKPLGYNDPYKWYYYPLMTNEECLLF